jgi:hypothetical protein
MEGTGPSKFGISNAKMWKVHPLAMVYLYVFSDTIKIYISVILVFLAKTWFGRNNKPMFV